LLILDRKCTAKVARKANILAIDFPKEGGYELAQNIEAVRAAH